MYINKWSDCPRDLKTKKYPQTIVPKLVSVEKVFSECRWIVVDCFWNIT